jgi:predicted acyltransferase
MGAKDLIFFQQLPAMNTHKAIQQRLFSLDALRGFDMFWIIGAEEVFHEMGSITHHPFWEGLSSQFEHPVWNGFTAYDLIFPLFIFLSGVSTPYAIGSAIAAGKSKNALLWKVIKRGMILVLLGIIYNNGLQLRPISDIRFMSVLGRIGIATMLGSIIYLYTKERTQIIWLTALLVGYWLLMKFTSAPGFLPGDLTEPGNFSSYFDRTVLPGKLSRGIHDTVGLFNNIPAISSALAGIITGNYLKNNSDASSKKSGMMALAGLVSLGIAQLWSIDFPINKNLWSSSFVMHTVGFSLLLFALFHYIIDVRGYTKLAFFFKVIGMNSILIYMSGKFISWSYANKGFFQWLGDLIGDPYNAVAMAISVVFIKWIFLYFLYQKKIFLKV